VVSTSRMIATRAQCTAELASSGGRSVVAARVIHSSVRGRLPVIGRPNADILHHGPPPAYAHGRGEGCRHNKKRAWRAASGFYLARCARARGRWC